MPLHCAPTLGSPSRIACVAGAGGLFGRNESADPHTAFPHQLNHFNFSVVASYDHVLQRPATFLSELRELANDPSGLGRKHRALRTARRMLAYAWSEDGSGRADDEGGGGDGGGARMRGAPDPFAESTRFGGATRAILEELLVEHETAAPEHHLHDDQAPPPPPGSRV